MAEVRMPQWGMNMTEGYIFEWLKRDREPNIDLRDFYPE